MERVVAVAGKEEVRGVKGCAGEVVAGPLGLQRGFR